MKLSLVLLSLLAGSLPAFAELRVPAFTAYSSPDVHSIHISEKEGAASWTDPAQQLVWYGEFKEPGDLAATVTLTLPEGATSKLRLTVDGKVHDGTATGHGKEPASVDFGHFTVAAGYQKFALESLNAPGQKAGDIQALTLAGPAGHHAHFNPLPRRNAASVHLRYPVPQATDVAAFYCEATGVEEPLSTYYMACGFSRGYFGMQINGPAERRIIFSVWDTGAGAHAAKRDEVAEADQTKLRNKGEGVVASAFGNEGTGGHSHFIYPWKTGEKQRFLVTAQPAENGAAIYSGYWFHPEKKSWLLLASFRAPKAAASLSGLYSFCEDFDGASGCLRRKALFGNQWICTRAGEWRELTESSFSHDPTGKEARLDRCMGVEAGQFFLANGGFVAGSTAYGEKFQRPATGKPPGDIDLAALNAATLPQPSLAK